VQGPAGQGATSPGSTTVASTPNCALNLGPAELATERVLRPIPPADADLVRQGCGVVNGGCGDPEDLTEDRAGGDNPAEGEKDHEHRRDDHPEAP